jgi:prolyl oligopeptidase
MRIRKDDIIEDFFGTKVEDPYRWFEDAESKDTIEWSKEQNKLTSEYLENIPQRSKIKKRLTELFDYKKYSIPIRKANRYFYRKNDGLQNQDIIYMKEDVNGEPKIVIDPNKLSEDGTIAVINTSYTKDGKILAYSLSESGSDWQEIRIKDIDSGKEYDEVIKWTRHSNIAWKNDNSGFYYSRFPEKGTVSEVDRNNYCKVYWHKLGTSQSEDKLIYEDPQNKELDFVPFITDDEKYLFMVVTHGTDTENRFYYKELDSDGDFIKLLNEADAYYDFIDNAGTTFYFITELDAPRGKIIAIDLNNPEKTNWTELVKETEDSLYFAFSVHNEIIACYMHNAYHRFFRYSFEGEFIDEIKLPGLGSIRDVYRNKDFNDELFFVFTSFLTPPKVYRYDFDKDDYETFFETNIDFNTTNYETKQVFYKSKDGTKVSMFLTHKKGLTLDGGNPVLLYAYGGFGISLTPSFSSHSLLWLENGGVFAVANLRGGGEYGEEWHKAGNRSNKQNVFDDFISAGEWLIENKYTSKDKLAIMGGSNGGLLVGAVTVQRPDLFGAVICAVGVLDMLRYHKFTLGHYWIGEYGNPEIEEDFRTLYAYSPLHNVKDGTEYPPMLITTADTDTRVVPAHSKKFTARLQEAQKGDNPILLRLEMKAGHGFGKPITKSIEEYTDIYSFLSNELKLT